jgi:hypothetical protein
MCGLCGAIGQGPSWEQQGRAGEEARWQLHREAAATAAEVTALLSPRRIKVTGSPQSGFVVAFPTGGSETVAGLAQLWHLLERRKIEIPDPLTA